MVCVPCFIVPILLFLWHKFIQPYLLRFWNPWAVKDADGNVKTDFPIKCEGGVCAFQRKPKPVENETAKALNDKERDEINNSANKLKSQ